jgi:hypothetical protein
VHLRSALPVAYLSFALLLLRRFPASQAFERFFDVPLYLPIPFHPC